MPFGTSTLPCRRRALSMRSQRARSSTQSQMKTPRPTRARSGAFLPEQCKEGRGDHMTDQIDEEFQKIVQGVESESSARTAVARHMREAHGVGAAAGPLTGVVELEALTAEQLFSVHDRLH